MLSRRMLIGAAGAGLLAGCGIMPAPMAPSPAPVPDPSVPGHAALRGLRTSLEAHLDRPLGAAQVGLLRWMLDVNDDQFPAVSVAAPPRATSSASPTSTRPPTTPTPASLTQLAEALREASAAFAAQALDPSTARPSVWASMAAWSTAVGAHLADAGVAREPARGVTLPAPQLPDEAIAAAVEATDATRYGLEVAAGAPGLLPEDRERLRARIAFWTGLRADLDGGVRAVAGTPAPVPPWFTADQPADAATARAEVARLQAAALPILGRSVAQGPPWLQELLLPSVGDIAADVPRWGGLLERWPGLPTT